MIPKPLKESYESRKIVLSKEICVDFGQFEHYCISAFLERTGLSLSQSGTKMLLVSKKMNAEEYVLHVSESGIEIYASSEKGVIWALTTLYKLMDENGEVPYCKIEDKPKYEVRSQSLDCSRHFFCVKEVEKVIEGISLFKMNRLHWHLSDDQGWRIESKKYPRLNEISGEFYTHSEIKDIVDYAKARGVDILPEIDMPGHVTAILAAYPQYSCTGEEIKLKTEGGIFNRILCAGKDEVFNFIEDILDEICPLFPYERFHIGGDEAPKTYWKECPRCKKKMKELGLWDTEQLQGWFSERVASILRKYKKKPVCWNEILKSERVPKDTVIQYWTLQHKKQMEPYVRNGGKWVYSNMFELYFDYPYSMTGLKRVYAAEPGVGRNKLAGDGLLGLESCIWAERINTAERLEELLFPRVCAVSEIGWGTRNNYTDFVNRLKTELPILCKSGIVYRCEEDWNPKGRRRGEETASYISLMGLTGSDNNEEKENTKYNPEVVWNFLTKFLCLGDIPYLFKMLVK